MCNKAVICFHAKPYVVAILFIPTLQAGGTITTALSMQARINSQSQHIFYRVKLNISFYNHIIAEKEKNIQEAQEQKAM